MTFELERPDLIKPNFPPIPVVYNEDRVGPVKELLYEMKILKDEGYTKVLLYYYTKRGDKNKKIKVYTMKEYFFDVLEKAKLFPDKIVLWPNRCE